MKLPRDLSGEVLAKALEPPAIFGATVSSKFRFTSR